MIIPLSENIYFSAELGSTFKQRPTIAQAAPTHCPNMWLCVEVNLTTLNFQQMTQYPPIHECTDKNTQNQILRLNGFLQNFAALGV